MGPRIDYDYKMSEKEYDLYCKLYNTVFRFLKKNEDFKKGELQYILTYHLAREMAKQFYEEDDDIISSIKNEFALTFNTNFEREIMKHKMK